MLAKVPEGLEAPRRAVYPWVQAGGSITYESVTACGMLDTISSGCSRYLVRLGAAGKGGRA